MGYIPAIPAKIRERSNIPLGSSQVFLGPTEQWHGRTLASALERHARTYLEEFTMKRLASLFIHAAVALVSFVIFGGTALAGAGQVSVGLQASGTISTAPAWQDSNNVVIPVAEFNFDNNLAGTATRDLDSQPYQIKLVGAKIYPVTVQLVTPGTCTIGASIVNDGHVQFGHSGVVSTANGDFDIDDAALKTYFLRFAEAGNYGDKSGLVTCKAPGSLTFKY